MELRPQCRKCPWRDLERMCVDGFQSVIEHAHVEPDGFVCHTRMGPCDGPRHMLEIAWTG